MLSKMAYWLPSLQSHCVRVVEKWQVPRVFWGKAARVLVNRAYPALALVHDGIGTKIRTTKITSKHHHRLFMKLCTPENNPLYCNLCMVQCTVGCKENFVKVS